MKKNISYQCDFCKMKDDDPDFVRKHEALCQCNPKNNPCSKCKGSGKIWMTYGDYHIKYHGADPDIYGGKVSPFMSAECPKCKGTGKSKKS